MPRLRSTPFVAALLLAGAFGCTTFSPDPAPEAAPVVTPVATSPAAAASQSGADPSSALVPSPGPADPTDRVGTRPPPRPTSGAARARAPARAAAPPSGGTRTATASAGERPGPESAGPTVTTFVFSDAPAPVRREAARGETVPGPSAGRVPAGFNPYRIAFEAGTYRCELGRRVEIRSVSADQRSTVLRWGEGDYTLRSVDARSGALRYEDAGSGLAWIVLKDRAMLLDTRAGQRLANACRARG
jgi:hypothetical protein